MGQKIKVDLTGVENFKTATEGVHPVKIASAEVKQSQSGNDMITVAFEVTKGADKGARVFENYPLVDNALWKLKGLLQAIGMKCDGKVQIDLDKLVGKVLSINVIHEEYEGKVRARVESTMKFSAEATDDDEDIDDVEDEEEEQEPEEKPAKKDKKADKKSKKAEPVEDDDDDDWDDDEEDEEEDEKPAKKSTKKEEKSKKEDKKSAKKSKKEEPEEDDDDWDDDDDDDWDEE